MEPLEQALNLKHGAHLRKAGMLLLCRLWGYRSNLWQARQRLKRGRAESSSATSSAQRELAALPPASLPRPLQLTAAEAISALSGGLFVLMGDALSAARGDRLRAAIDAGGDASFMCRTHYLWVLHHRMPKYELFFRSLGTQARVAAAAALAAPPLDGDEPAWKVEHVIRSRSGAPSVVDVLKTCGQGYLDVQHQLRAAAAEKGHALEGLELVNVDETLLGARCLLEFAAHCRALFAQLLLRPVRELQAAQLQLLRLMEAHAATAEEAVRVRAAAHAAVVEGLRSREGRVCVDAHDVFAPYRPALAEVFRLDGAPAMLAPERLEINPYWA